MAVFKNFIWDNSVKDKDGRVVECKTINIMYGRNYSGKTTLSRIVRALETGFISDKYNNPEFEIEFDDGTKVNQTQLKSNVHYIRVFNEDFVRENLSFLKDTSNDGTIKPFAVLGEDNTKLQNEIDALKVVLGSNEEGKETGLYKERVLKTEAFNKAQKDYEKVCQDLNNKLSNKATGDRSVAIKYKPELYGDQNYNVSKLRKDIQIIENDYNPLVDERKEELRSLIKETVKNIIPKITEIRIDLPTIRKRVQAIVEQKVGDAQKIEELVRDAELNRWVKEGRKYHKEKMLDYCSFCGSLINDDRWEALDKHFDEESEKLEKEIDALSSQITEYEKRLNNGLGINKNAFYLKFQTEINSIEKEYNNNVRVDVLNGIKSLQSQLLQRKNNLYKSFEYKDVNDFTIGLSDLYEKYYLLEEKSNEYSTKLLSEQEEAKKQLRIDEVYRFIQEINYFDELKRIDSLKVDCESKETEKKSVESKIINIETEIETKLTLMNDEEKGAEKVDEYLRDYFGHHYLSLKAKEDNDGSCKRYRFEILRNGDIAYNLSEGECSLIAFCYFMAKLEDISTYGKKPIIWIDDPISSLDNNNVFSIYSIIVSKIADTDSFNQLFVSTHNLDFLGYLKRMNGKYVNGDKSKQKQYFCITRSFEESYISTMPNYLKEHITEFNYLFKEIYVCSKSDVVDNSNFQAFYSFGNNARKFLEIFLFYKYPDETEERVKMEKFFGKDKVPVIFSERINNEYSHLKENVSRGFSTIDVPEMKRVAELIISSIKNNDGEQYKALLNSVGEKE